MEIKNEKTEYKSREKKWNEEIESKTRVKLERESRKESEVKQIEKDSTVRD